MTSLNLSLPEPLKTFIETKVASGSYSSVSEYIRELIRTVQQEEAKQEVEALLLEGIQSEASEMTKADWDELKRRIGDRHTERPNGR